MIHPQIAIRRFVRIALLAVHLVSGVLLAALALPFLGMRQRDGVIRWWAGRLLRVLGVRMRSTPPPNLPRGALLVCNHVSWLDIYLILVARRVHFVSKSEVRAWPVVGWLAHKVGTLFLERGRRADTARINAEMRTLMSTGCWVAVFPEGTTSDGRGIKRFLPSLLQPAVELDCPVVPAALRYRTLDGAYSAAPAYIDDISLWESLKRIVDAPGLVAELHFGAPIRPDGHRRELAAAAETATARLLGAAPARGTPPDARPTGGLGAAPADSPAQTPVDPPAAPQ
ncbi:MAG: lysophospholipid acyltransferase family protein [Pseudomonadota bacterium]